MLASLRHPLETHIMESISIHSHPRISIDLAGQDTGFVASYSTWDRIDGTVTVEVDHDVQFDDIDITFEGTIAFTLFLGFGLQTHRQGQNSGRASVLPGGNHCLPFVPEASQSGRRHCLPIAAGPQTRPHVQVPILLRCPGPSAPASLQAPQEQSTGGIGAHPASTVLG